MRLFFSTVLFLIIPLVAFPQNNPGFLGKKRVIKIEHGLFIQNADQPHGINNDAAAYSFIPSFIRNRNRIGVTYEHILLRNLSVSGSLFRYNSYADEQRPTFWTDNAPPGFNPFFMSSSSNDNFKASNTQLSAAMRVYNRFAPIGLYIELGVSGIFYATDEVDFVEVNVNNDPVGLGNDETIKASGFNWMGHIGLGYNQFLSDELLIGFDLRLYMRNFAYLDGVGEDIFIELRDPNIPLEDRFNMYIEENSLTTIGFGFTFSVGYMF